MVDFFEIVQNPFVIRGLIAIVLIAVNAAIAGSFTIFRDASFLVAGTAHAALAGAAFAIVVGMYGILSWVDPLWGAIVFAVLLAGAAGYASRKGSKTDLNTSIGIGFAMSMSIAVLLISLIQEYASRVWGILFGDLLLLTDRDIILLAAVTAVLSFLAILFYREFIFISFDIEGAIAYGIRVPLFNYLMLAMIALSVVVLLKGVGAILVFAMLISPAATANRMSRSVPGVILYSFLIALFCGFVSLVISFFVQISPGALAALIATTMYFVVFAVRR
ncbi:MAG: metal ABC transporter permease [Thermoplasmata archaeon]